jgi:dedicated sortase system histidine kinase
VSIRLQLLLVALATLVLPWAGCQYAGELEAVLRASQENALVASADTMARALSAEPERVFRDQGDPQPFSRDEGDLYAPALHGQPLLDGYQEDWGIAADLEPLPTTTGYAARLQVAATERYLFLYLEVDDPHFMAEGTDVHPEQDRFDRVDLTLQNPGGSLESYFFATAAPGLIEAQSVVRSDDGVDHATVEPRMLAYWLQTSRGYHLEARLPRTLVGRRLWIAVRGEGGAVAGFTGADLMRGGRLFMATSGLDAVLATFIRPGTRATVVDANALKLGAAGTLRSGTPGDNPRPGGSWYRRFVTADTTRWPMQVNSLDRVNGASVTQALGGHSAAEWMRTDGRDLVLVAAAPILIGTETRGAVVLEQAGDQLLELRDRALGRLFNLTLLATLVAVLFAFGIATLISLRIGRLRAAAGSAVGSDGRIRREMPESARADEIGALARAFEGLLARLDEHTQYLRTLGGKLSHELRTPLTIVRSSLDNLESEGVRADQSGFVTRAREGVARLQSILSALGAAARVEEIIKQAERVSFDLKALLSSAVAGYRDAFSGRRIELTAPPDECSLRGAPDLIAQLLDKLVENAVDFCPPGGTIDVRLIRAGSHYELSVINDGPPIPPQILERLFESLFEQRTGRDEKPHFGLGLYIVRLIAEFHGGKASAGNAQGRGAEFTIVLPLI